MRTAAHTTPESWKGSRKVNSPTRQRFSQVDSATCCDLDEYPPQLHSFPGYNQGERAPSPGSNSVPDSGQDQKYGFISRFRGFQCLVLIPWETMKIQGVSVSCLDTMGNYETLWRGTCARRSWVSSARPERDYHWSYWSLNEQSTSATHVACPETQRRDEHRCGSRLLRYTNQGEDRCIWIDCMGAVANQEKDVALCGRIRSIRF